MRAALAALGLAACLGCATTGEQPAPREYLTHCTSNAECGNAECIKPRGEVRGLCGRLGDEHGNPTTSIRRTADACQNDSDCPVKFRCEKTTPSLGVCVQAL